MVREPWRIDGTANFDPWPAVAKFFLQPDCCRKHWTVHISDNLTFFVCQYDVARKLYLLPLLWYFPFELVTSPIQFFSLVFAFLHYSNRFTLVLAITAALPKPKIVLSYMFCHYETYYSWDFFFLQCQTATLQIQIFSPLKNTWGFFFVSFIFNSWWLLHWRT